MAGVEWDRLVPLGEGAPFPLTALREPDGALIVRMGNRVELDVQPPSAAELSRRYGIGQLQSGDASWSPSERWLLGEALDLLSPVERAYLRGLNLYRYHEPPRKSGVAAMYIGENGLGRIELYDEVFEVGGFCGEVDHPRPTPERAILHELGHALSRAPLLLLLQWRSDRTENLHELGDQLNSAVAGQKEDELDEVIDRIGRSLSQHNLLSARVQAEWKEPRVLTQYRAVRGLFGGPTRYGRTNLAESFAESFSLFRADPAALRRIYPRVAAWFEAGGHVRAVQEAVQ